VLFHDYIENLALITQLPFQSKLEKFQIFQVIAVPDNVAYQFWQDISYAQQLLLIFSCTTWARWHLSLQNLPNTWPFACRNCLWIY